MNFTSEIAKRIPAGDQKPVADQNQAGYKKADIAGFVHPVVEGKPNMSVYIPEAAIGGETAPPTFTKQEALAQTGKPKKSPADVLYGEKK